MNDEAVYRTAPATPGLLIIAVCQLRTLRAHTPCHLDYSQNGGGIYLHIYKSIYLCYVKVTAYLVNVFLFSIVSPASSGKNNAKIVSFECVPNVMWHIRLHNFFYVYIEVGNASTNRIPLFHGFQSKCIQIVGVCCFMKKSVNPRTMPVEERLALPRSAK